MRAPLFVICVNGDVLVFRDPEAALRWVESPDVESGEYVAVFDADGRRFKLDVIEPTRRRKGLFGTSIELTPVTFKSLEDKATGADELRALLVKQMPGVAPSAPLSDLVQHALTKLRSP
jgi:hypothetical protein